MRQLRQPIELILFDLGGTLIYENAAWDGLFQRADQELWKVLHNAGVMLEPADIYGDSQNLFEVYYKLHRNDLNEPTSSGVLDEILRAKGYRLDEATLRSAMRAMFTVTQSNWLPEPDAGPTLGILKERGLHLGVISNASDDDNTQALIDKAGLRPYLPYVLSSAAHGRRKPDPGIFRSALDYFGITPGRSIMVGDNYEADILGAGGLGMQAIWITRRVSDPAPEPAKARADAVVSTLQEIPSLLGPF